MEYGHKYLVPPIVGFEKFVLVIQITVYKRMNMKYPIKNITQVANETM